MNKDEIIACKSEIVQHMISYIQTKEYELQANKSLSDTQSKNEAVKMILGEIEKVVDYED